MHLQSAAVLVAFSLVASAQQTAWGQCGGKGWTGLTTCVSGYVCTFSNDWYSQCIPGTAPPGTTVTPIPPTSTSVVTNNPSTVTTTPPPSTTSGSAGSGPGTTLQSGYYWIRAVEAPNFHKYLQTKPVYTTGLAILDSYTTAGQFQVVDGQLVELISGGLLYAVVSPQTDSSVTKLAVTFSTSKNTYGTFAWSGDALTWTVSGISRPNNAAWLVCANQQLFINLGSYGYMTPEGCADETIHYYNDKTANS